MELTELQRQWDRLGQRDPFWAILTRDDKRDGGWTAGEFFADGIREIDEMLRAARRFGITIPNGRALDFGCGAGRLTQALCGHFEHADGVDIAPAMLALAREHNRYPDRCAYHLHQSSDLGLFPDGAFNFVCSLIVLQHVPQASARDYIREFVRVLAPGGLLVFQIPSDESGAASPAAPGRRSAAKAALAADALRARILVEQSPPTTAAGRSFPVRITVQNLGRDSWPALPAAGGWGQVTLGNQWRHMDDSLLVRDDARVPLPRDLDPRDDLDLIIAPTAPAEPGRYLLDFDMVEEGVCWFGERDSERAQVPIVVTPATVPAAEAIDSKSAIPPPRRPRFRERHPTTFAWLQKTGGLSLIRGMQRLMHPAAKPDWREMEMNCLPIAEVEAMLDAAGARLVVAERHLLPGFRSYRYWVARRG